MLPRLVLLMFALCLCTSLFGQKKFNTVKDLKPEWMMYEDDAYRPLHDFPFRGLNTIYIQLESGDYGGRFLRLSSASPYFLFLNGKVRGEYTGQAVFNLDSLARLAGTDVLQVAVHQEHMNERDLRTELVSTAPGPSGKVINLARPYSHFRDFVVVSGLLIMLLFVMELRLNPKLAGDYFSIGRILSSREADDSQASARLTSGANVQFYILCSLLIGFYLIIVFHHLPPRYALPIPFEASGFWMSVWQWLKISALVFSVFLFKLLIIFSITRLFGMRGMARFHFFNWMRLLLLVFGIAVVILFIYFILHGNNPEVFIVFLDIVVATLIAWIALAIYKLSGRTSHSLFHLFSYLCATEIIPLLITVKILFQ
jgi:hypothetical protein